MGHPRKDPSRGINVNPSGEWQSLGIDDAPDPADNWAIPTVSAIPLPAALPLFGTGLALLGFMGWRKKRKANAA